MTFSIVGFDPATDGAWDQSLEATLRTWVITENLDQRWYGGDRIDPVVLDYLLRRDWLDDHQWLFDARQRVLGTHVMEAHGECADRDCGRGVGRADHKRHADVATFAHG